MYEGVFEIQSYEVGIWDQEGSSPGGPWYFHFGPKRYLTAMGKDPDTGEKFSIWFMFGATANDEDGNPVMGSMFFPKAYDADKSPSRASFWVTPDEDYYADIYTILRTEKPVYFHYRSEEGLPTLPTPPATDESDYSTAGDATSVYYFCVKTGMEPVGEGVDKDAETDKLKRLIRFPRKK